MATASANVRLGEGVVFSGRMDGPFARIADGSIESVLVAGIRDRMRVMVLSIALTRERKPSNRAPATSLVEGPVGCVATDERRLPERTPL
eukprot:664313-Prorocentrum_minimum.AAC.2